MAEASHLHAVIAWLVRRLGPAPRGPRRYFSLSWSENAAHRSGGPPGRKSHASCRLPGSGRMPVSAGHVLQPEVVTPTGPEPGSTAECDSCGTAVLLVSGPAVDLWCHGMRMRTAEGVRCSEPVGPQHGGGLIAGAIYMERTTSSMLRCTRSRSGWPKSRTGALAPASPGRLQPALLRS